jgi:ABC-type Fe3+ transport system substrate-binding protein
MTTNTWLRATRIALAAIAGMAIALIAVVAAAQGTAKNLPPGVVALLAAAKAEGYTATVYGQTLNPQQVGEFNKRISAFYGVPLKFNLISGLHPQKASELVQAAKMGAESGIDIFWTSSAIAGTLERGGVLAAYDWIKELGLPEELRWSANGLRAHDGTLATIVYNTDLIKPADAPKTYQEIGTNPKWKGRIAAPRAPNTLIYMSYAIGDEAAQELAKNLVEKQDLKILPTYPDVRNRVGAGEFAIGIGVDAILLKRQGAPIETAAIDPTVLTPWGFWLMKDAKKPATGKLWAYWAATPEGQKSLSEIHGISLVSTPGTELNALAKGKKVVLVPHDFMVEILPKKLPTYGALLGIK